MQQPVTRLLTFCRFGAGFSGEDVALKACWVAAVLISCLSDVVTACLFLFAVVRGVGRVATALGARWAPLEGAAAFGSTVLAAAGLATPGVAAFAAEGRSLGVAVGGLPEVPVGVAFTANGRRKTGWTVGARGAIVERCDCGRIEGTNLRGLTWRGACGGGDLATLIGVY